MTGRRPTGDRSHLPGWPAAMRDTLAADYLDMSVGTFRKHVAPEVHPIQLSPGRVGWLRMDLDRWLDCRRRKQRACVNEWHTPSRHRAVLRVSREGLGLQNGGGAEVKLAKADP